MVVGLGKSSFIVSSYSSRKKKKGNKRKETKGNERESKRSKKIKRRKKEKKRPVTPVAGDYSPHRFQPSNASEATRWSSNEIIIAAIDICVRLTNGWGLRCVDAV